MKSVLTGTLGQKTLGQKIYNKIPAIETWL